ncbi:unnamed protein product [Ectocarpus sp. CCAP 1310/34]|nr:unnamed protein product [Ectocarpus sp. CCAP 1310/34]
MTRACATLTLFLGLPQGTMGFASSFSACRSQASAAPRTALLRAWGRTSSGSSSERQPLRHLRRRRSEGLVASLSTKGEREGNPATEEEAQLLQHLSSPPKSQRRHQQQPQQPRTSTKRGTTRKRLTSTGGLKSLPIVTPSIELLSHASRRSKKVSQDMLIKNARNRSRKWVAERMDMLGKATSKPLRDIIRQYKHQLPILHPFEATLADLTVRAREKTGERTLQSVLDDVNDFRKVALEISKSAAREGKLGEKKSEIMQTMDAGYSRMEDHFLTNGSVLEDLTEIQKSLRSLPIVQLHLPTVVLVGAPNVGKSSIVRAVSTGTPEVNSYPFTTRGMALGHMFHPETNARYQIMDTPGVLSRPDGERNEMEALTLASMQHLPTAVIFVMDLSGHSGHLSSLDNQMQVRHELRRRFPRRPWLDVVSKADLPRLELEKAKEALPEGYLDLSTLDGTGVEELKTRLFEMYEIIERILAPPPEVQR